MRVIISIILMVIAAVVGFFFGAGMNEAMGGAMRDELAATEATITKLRDGKEKAAVLEADAKGIQLLNEYRPKELRKLIEKVCVYENGRIEIDFRCHDDFTEKIIKAVAQLAG